MAFDCEDWSYAGKVELSGRRFRDWSLQTAYEDADAIIQAMAISADIDR